MFLGVTWAVTAAMVGFTLGRLSMYGKEEPEEVRAEAKSLEVVHIGTESTSARGTGMPSMESAQPETESASMQNAGTSDVESAQPEAESASVRGAGSLSGADGKTKRTVRLSARRLRGAVLQGTAPRGGGRRAGAFQKGHRNAEEGQTWSVGSPVSGEVTVSGGGGRTKVVIQPREDRLYAPAGGKITRLFPLGNALLFTTEFGAELFIQAGDAGDELLSRYYRPRILQNEVVGKGKLLLEFDRQGLEGEGVSSQVSVCVENCCYGGSVRTTAAQWVSAGEEILQVQEPAAGVNLKKI